MVGRSREQGLVFVTKGHLWHRVDWQPRQLLAKFGLHQHHLRLDQFDAMGQFTITQAPVQRRQDQPRLGRGQFHLYVLKTVARQDSEAVAVLQTAREQGVGEAVRARLELGVAQAAGAVDHRRMRRVHGYADMKQGADGRLAGGHDGSRGLVSGHRSKLPSG